MTMKNYANAFKVIVTTIEVCLAGL